MALPKYNELMKPLLCAITDGEVHTLKDVTTVLAKQLNLSAADLKEKLPSGNQSVFKNRVGWARTYLNKAGLLDVPMRGSIVITEAGKKVVAENPASIDSKYLKRFKSFLNFIHPAKSNGSLPVNSDSDDLTPDDQLEAAYKQINDTLASDLLHEVLQISPYTFEKLVVDLLSSMGYGAIAYGSHATVASRDDGIDGVIMEDQLGFSLIYIQAKKWALDAVVSQPDIQSFVGAIAGKHGHGLFVTTARFSKQAQEYADNHHIILIDGNKLAHLMIKHNFCVSPRKTFEIKTIDTDALSEYLDDSL